MTLSWFDGFHVCGLNIAVVILQFSVLVTTKHCFLVRLHLT